MKSNNINILLENEIRRYNQIISYNNNSLKETTYRFFNEADEEQPNQDPNAMAQDPNMNAQDPNAMAQDPNMGMDANAGQAPAQDPSMQAPPAPDAVPTPDMAQTPDMGAEGSDDTEVDVTELVNATNTIAQRIEKTTGSLQRIYDKINDLEGSLSKMDAVITKMGELEKQVQLMRPPTEDERRKALADKSYPYNVTNQDYMGGSGYKTQTAMEQKPDRMSMMDSLMSDYDKNDIKRSFYTDDKDKREGN
jgi:hypothetical protein